MVFKRIPNRVYTIIDFADEEPIVFYAKPDKPESIAAGSAFYRSTITGNICLLDKEQIDYCSKDL